MFILKRKDVEIISVQNPQRKEQQIAILQYQGQTFRLLNIFGDNREEALEFWRDLTDNKGKACVLLEEPKRFSVWGKVKIDQYQASNIIDQIVERELVQGCLLLLQAVYFEVEDFLGNRQAGSFKQDMYKLMAQGKFSQVSNPKDIEQLLELDPISSMQIPSWDDNRLQTLLGDLFKLAQDYFGNNSFVDNALDALEDMPESDRQKFGDWLKSTPKGKLWR
ncbi:hypothetical protein Pse7367_2790 [Thalassoporum mexicanum PCC 7367]|uniref:Npun_F0813 family protein n=1 Tax=Thalassoporum mexicanum TaxID=3457544 RepID=UPI00029F9A8C|nr:Npun_F0813 family protein [Pseudanabaena sp. PCC 7367]AFY71043.1 hypothetical protein Pse7367_2790 [Pseudanabaena sp. PCC 7367]